MVANFLPRSWEKVVWERVLTSALDSLRLPKLYWRTALKTFLKFALPLSTGTMGEAGQRGGDTSDQVLYSVEEAKREGDTTGNQRQRKSKNETPNLLGIIGAMGRQESHVLAAGWWLVKTSSAGVS